VPSEPVGWQSVGKVFCSVFICEGREEARKGKVKVEKVVLKKDVRA